jgi:hypothetical protein
MFDTDFLLSTKAIDTVFLARRAADKMADTLYGMRISDLPFFKMQVDSAGTAELVRIGARGKYVKHFTNMQNNSSLLHVCAPESADARDGYKSYYMYRAIPIKETIFAVHHAAMDALILIAAANDCESTSGALVGMCETVPWGKICGGCGATSAKLLKCRTCKTVRYCSKECQLKHWPRHRVGCAEAEEAAAVDVD